MAGDLEESVEVPPVAGESEESVEVSRVRAKEGLAASREVAG